MLVGNGMFIWLVNRCENGNHDRIVAACLDAGLSHVLIKVSNGTYGEENGPTAYLKPLFDKLKAAGIQAWAWSYVYGYYPVEEAQIAAVRTRDLGATGFVVDVEGQYDVSGKATQAKTFMSTFRGILPEIGVGLSSYRYPSMHRAVPWREFLEKCDFAMPQVYWMQATNGGIQLEITLQEYKNLYKQIGFSRPIFPTGAAFSEHGWTSTPQQITEFIAARVRLGLPGQNWWEYYEARHQQPLLWEAATGKAATPPQDPDPFPYQVTPTVPVLNVRNGPGLTYNIVRQVKAGYIMDVFKQTGDWLQVYVPQPMWVYAPLTKLML